MSPALEHLPLAAITVDLGPGWLDPERVAGYVGRLRRGARLDPLMVFRLSPSGPCWLARGFHRCRAYQRVGRESVWCRVVAGSRADARLYSLLVYPPDLPTGKCEGAIVGPRGGVA